MLEKGKRRIGFIGDYEHCQSFFERYTAFRSAMTLAGVPVDERFCLKVTGPDMEHIPYPVTEDMIYQAMEAVENL